MTKRFAAVTDDQVLFTLVSEAARKLGAVAVESSLDESPWAGSYDVLVYDEDQIGGEIAAPDHELASVLVGQEELREWQANDSASELERRLSEALQW